MFGDDAPDRLKLEYAFVDIGWRNPGEMFFAK